VPGRATSRIEAIGNGRSGLRLHRRHPTAAADLEHAFPVERNEHGDRRRLDPLVVAPLDSLGTRFVGLDGGAAGAEPLCLATRVFELEAGVGVDELAGFDPLEAVTL
jgi:hypothetical protein